MFNRDNGFFGLVLDAVILGSAYYMGKKEIEKRSTQQNKMDQEREINDLKKQVADLKRIRSTS